MVEQVEVKFRKHSDSPAQHSVDVESLPLRYYSVVTSSVTRIAPAALCLCKTDLMQRDTQLET